ncbi:MAG TPA: helix-turn-helix transcriptional regulator [Acidimicrobiales bacterium]|nr:helix-turn-helix transcriptional regulator [Acidimicrobiales bacterium]
MSQSTASRLIREARAYSGLRQAELARRAAIPRSVLNAYERGRRQPSAAALARIVDAAGLRLRLGRAVRILDDERAARLFGQVLDLAEQLPTRRRGSLKNPAFRGRVRAAR